MGTMTLNYGQGTVDRPSQGWKLFMTATIMVILAGAFVIARLVVRLKSKLFGWDDYTIAFSLVRSSPSIISFQERNLKATNVDLSKALFRHFDALYQPR